MGKFNKLVVEIFDNEENEMSDKCKLTLKTPEIDLQTNKYFLFTKDGDRNFIEVNNITVEDLLQAHKVLTKIIDENINIPQSQYKN